MRLGPILRYELTRTARRRRHYAGRAALAATLVLGVFYLFRTQYLHLPGLRARLDSGLSLPPFADLLFLLMISMQGLAVLVLVPGMVAGSLAGEDRRGTMLDLLASPLSSAAIVSGKLAASLSHIGVAFLLGLPVVVPLGLMGLLDPAVVIPGCAMFFSFTLFVAALSILAAVVVRRPRAATLAAYFLVGAWLVLPLWFASATRGLSGPISYLRTLNRYVLLSHPAESVFFLEKFSEAKLFRDPGGANFTWSILSSSLPWLLALQAFGSSLFLLLSVVCLRPLRLGRWERNRRRGRASVPDRPAVGDDPMRWKERHAAPRPFRRAARAALVLLGAVLFVTLSDPADGAFREWRASWKDDAHTTVWHRQQLNESLRQANAGLYVFGLVAVAAVAATSVSGERERGTWVSLTTTPVTGREVVRAKVSGAVRSVRGLAVPFLVLWAVGLATGSVHPAGALAAAVGLVVFLRYAAALGVFCSMVAGSSERAVASTILALFAGTVFPLLFVPLDLIGPLAGSKSGMYLAGVTPFVEWFALASPVEVHAALNGRIVWDARVGLPFGLWNTRVLLGPGLLRMYFVGLAVHAAGAAVASRAASWTFDRSRGARRSAAPSPKTAGARLERPAPTAA